MTTQEVTRKTGISLRQLNHWDQLGIIGPSAQPALGSGTRRRYSPQDIFLLLAAAALRSANAPLDFVREAVSRIRLEAVHTSCPDPTWLVGTPDAIVYLGQDSSRVIESAAAGSVAYVANLAVCARKAAEIATQTAEPETRIATIDGKCVQCIVMPTSSGFQAWSNAFPGRRSHGSTADQAVETLRNAIEQAAPTERTPLAATKRSKAVQRDGASSWGGNW